MSRIIISLLIEDGECMEGIALDAENFAFQKFILNILKEINKDENVHRQQSISFQRQGNLTGWLRARGAIEIIVDALYIILKIRTYIISTFVIIYKLRSVKSIRRIY